MTTESSNAAFLPFKKALIERTLTGEMNHQTTYPVGETKLGAISNQRNGKGAKTVLTEGGPFRIEVRRDHDSSFELLSIPKHERRFTGFYDKIVAPYALGTTVHEIQDLLLDQYATEVSPPFIRSITDEVTAEVTVWRTKLPEPMHPVVFFDALWVKICEDAVVRNRLSIRPWRCRPTAPVDPEAAN